MKYFNKNFRMKKWAIFLMTVALVGIGDFVHAAEKEAQVLIKNVHIFNGVDAKLIIGDVLVALSGERNRYREGLLGVIKKGAYADLILVDGNPLDDITILSDPDKNLKLIMKDGKIYKNTL